MRSSPTRLRKASRPVLPGLALIVVFLAAACTVGPDYKRPAATVRAQYVRV